MSLYTSYSHILDIQERDWVKVYQTWERPEIEVYVLYHPIAVANVDPYPKCSRGKASLEATEEYRLQQDVPVPSHWPCCDSQQRKKSSKEWAYVGL